LSSKPTILLKPKINFAIKKDDKTIGTGTLTYAGKTYKTVIINGKEWMAENLAYLPAVSPDWDPSEIEPCYYVYG
jgi:hypothetical protein